MVVPSLIDGAQAFWFKRRPMGMLFVPPQELGSTIGHLWRSWAHPLHHCYWNPLIHMRDFIWPSNNPSSYFISFWPSWKTNYSCYGAIWWDCHQKYCILDIILLYGHHQAKLGQIEPLRGLYKYKRCILSHSSSLRFSIYLSKDFKPTICRMIWMINAFWCV